MLSNIRHFKGLFAVQPASKPANENIDGKFTEWTSVQPSYISYKSNVIRRDIEGWYNPYYTNTTGRSDIVLATVARANNKNTRGEGCDFFNLSGAITYRKQEILWTFG